MCMPRLKIAFDWDDVIMDTEAYEAEMAEWLFEVNAAFLTERERRAVTKLVSATELALAVKPVFESVEYIHLLQQEGHELRIATSRDADFLAMALRVAERHGLTLDFHGVGRGKSKAPVVRGCDLFVDNEVAMLRDLEGVVPHRLLFSQKNNLCASLPRGVVRVSSWRELYQYIQRIQGEPRLYSLARV